MEGEGLVHFITWMTSVSTCLSGRQRGERSPIKRMHFAHAFFVLNQEQCIFHLAIVQNSSAWDRNHKKRPQACSFNRRPLPLSVYLSRHWHHAHDKNEPGLGCAGRYCRSTPDLVCSLCWELLTLVPRPHPLTRRNGLVNQVEFLGLAHAFATL